jgi:hypothetical protein
MPPKENTNRYRKMKNSLWRFSFFMGGMGGMGKLTDIPRLIESAPWEAFSPPWEAWENLLILLTFNI